MTKNSIEDLKQTFTGTIILPSDPAYENARSVLIRKGSPAIVAMVRTPGDVAAAIRYATDNRLTLSVRSGGHSGPGLSTNDGGMIIDVGEINDVSVVDESTHRVRIGAGARWGDVARKLHEHGLAISSGDTLSVGVSGLTLGAGVGWMVREQGLAIDNLQSVDIVTADGQLLTTSADSNPDLFWAVRGGGGNFGVVVALEFIAHPVGDVYFGPISFSADDPKGLLKGWRDYMRIAPEKLNTMVLLMPAKAMGENPEMFMVLCCWDGDDEATAQSALEPLRKLGTVVNDGVIKKHYYEALEEAHPPQGVHIEVNNSFFHDFNDEVIGNIVDGFSRHQMIFQIRSVGGAMNRVPADATAFAHRDSEVLVVCPKFFSPETSESDIQTALVPWRKIAAGGKGAYVNFFNRAGEDEVTASYPSETYQKLAKIKLKYDPRNIFDQNLNIKPSDA